MKKLTAKVRLKSGLVIQEKPTISSMHFTDLLCDHEAITGKLSVSQSAVFFLRSTLPFRGT
jgi:hypothetical protein